MKRFMLFSIMSLTAFAAFSQAQLQAVVRETSGKVEFKAPGKDWAPVTAKMVLSQGAMISTGFGSRLVIDIGQSRLTVNPLTRLSLEEIVKRDATNTTSLALKVGKVNASVKSAPGERSAFTVRGPASTAAVRGTEFGFDGYTLTVSEGTVQFSNLLGQQAPVGAGNQGATDGYTPPETGDTRYDVPAADANGLLGGTETGGGGSTPSAPTGTLVITVQ